MMTIHELQEKLGFAQERVDRAVKALAPKHKGGEWKEFREACDVLLFLERELASAKGEPYAASLDFPVKWDVGAPLPHLIASDNQAFLTFYIHEPDSEWDGTYVTVKSPGEDAMELLALVQFQTCRSAKMGVPNDEVHEGHPLFGRGLEPYTAQVVENSPWPAELEAINKVHSNYRPERWRKLKHYVFWFHDTTFECVAESFTVEVFRESMATLLGRVCNRLLR